MPAPTQTNYRTGISAAYSGTPDVDYWIEYLYHDQLVTDRCVVSLKSATQISLAHNERNKLRKGGNWATVGVNGEDGVPVSGDEGKIRFCVDGDLNYGKLWVAFGITSTGATYPVPSFEEYSGSFSFDSLSYPAGVAGGGAVLGSLGGNGQPYLPKSGYFHRGLTDSWGNECHWLRWADDDASIAATTAREWQATDGRIGWYRVNPMTPCIRFNASGNGQFYTTPWKTYFVPKIHDQTTYLCARTGAVSCELKDLYGQDVLYRINGGMWNAAAHPEIPHTAFNVGENLLEFYRMGNSAFVEKRKVVRISDAQLLSEFPSAGEAHGFLLFGNEENYSQFLTRITVDPYLTTWRKLVSGDSDPSGRSDWWRFKRRLGLRTFDMSGAVMNALVARVRGITGPNATQVQRSGGVHQGHRVSYADFSKEMLLENLRTIDPVGYEQDLGSTHPTKELFDRGYLDVGATFAFAAGYDLLISFYRSTDHANGITPVEDYYLRDCLAAGVIESLQGSAGMQGPVTYSDDAGMWQVARKCGGFVTCFAIPSYSTPYYGTCGLDGNVTVYPWTPTPSGQTWKKVLVDDDVALAAYPEYTNRLGIEGYMCLPNGTFVDKADYVSHMGNCFVWVANVCKYHYPSKTWPLMELYFLNAAKGKLLGNKSPVGPTTQIWLELINNKFVSIANASQTVFGTYTEQILKESVAGRFVSSAAWFDYAYEPTAEVETAPSIASHPNPVTILEGGDATFSVLANGTSPLAYQWQKDGVSISGQTSATLILTGVTLGSAGTYRCVVTNAVGSVASGAAALTVLEDEPDPPSQVWSRSAHAPQYVIPITP